MITENNYLALKDASGAANGLRLHYATAGDAGKPVMLFLHGFPQAWFVWEKLMAHYSARYFCVAPDLRGFNQSSKPQGVKSYAAKAIVGDILQLIAHVSREPITLVAHDWGGAIAWNLAVQHPQFIKKLVAINSPHPIPFARDMRPGGAQVAASAYMDWLAQPGSELALAKDDYALLEGFFGGMGQSATNWFSPAVRARYHAMWGNLSDSTEHSDFHPDFHPLSGCVNYYRATPLTPAKVAAHDIHLNPADWQVTVPTRVVWGEQDIALPTNLLDGLDECIADLSIVRVPHGNHWLIDAYPQDVIAAIGDFV
jgi:pimeloyl-ACP methyl ester carboxylesterase